ncbi:hypothetical protein P3X46_029003 [Hevea brasiliensis]|uniref:Josephin-like protein n=1 Tax=Hevea brasiliensis TaxID=3981 RepID=A0ABQ9KQU9_HEVBR|nr:josephin-like protein [Hevea brasiliensis]KAJ9146776.1 hypothetical protein P3X46_029003 [Hevea brasiliensis]
MSKKNNQKYHIPSISKKAISQKQNSIGNKVAGNRGLSGCCCGFRLPKRSEISPLNFLKRLESKVAKALQWKRPSSAGRPRPLVAPIDTHRTEAITECIEFINSSSFPRSNSATGNPS